MERERVCVCGLMRTTGDTHHPVTAYIEGYASLGLISALPLSPPSFSLSLYLSPSFFGLNVTITVQRELTCTK